MQPALFSRVRVYMRRLFVLVTIVATPLLAQPRERRQPPYRIPPNAGAGTAEAAVKQAMEQLANVRKAFERDLEVLTHLRTADAALVDNMQPTVSVQKAYEEVEKAKLLNPEFTVMQGVIKAERELEGARRSPIGADFGHLRLVLRDEALGPASRLVVRNALRLQEETTAWIKVQELIAAHLHALNDIASESLRESQKE